MNSYARSLASLCAVLSCAVAAQETVTLRVGDWMPESHHVSSHGGKVFMEKASELSNGRIKFQFFPAEQLGKAKDSLQMAQSGVADIVNIAPAYITDKFPLAGVAELPGIYAGACRGSYALHAMLEPGGEIYEAEYKPNGIRNLFSAAIGSYHVMTTNRRVDGMADFKGLKLRTAGGPMDQTAELLGAASIRMAGPEVLVSLQRGTLDGVFWPILSVKPWGIHSVLRYWTPNLGVGSFVVYWAISERSWSRIPKDLQDVLIEAGRYATKAHCEFVDSTEADEIKFLEAQGMTAVSLPEADVRAIAAHYGDIYQDWAKRLDDRGRPGSQILEAFRRRVAD